MRRNLAVGGLLACLLMNAQTAASPELEKAREEAEHARRLVELGALPRRAIDEARLVLEEAEDQAVLRRTLYGVVKLQDLTESDAEAMLAAAERLADRQKVQLERAQRLVREGAIASSRLAPLEAELRKRQETVAQAHRRAGLFRELVAMVRLEEALGQALSELSEEAEQIADRFDGSGVFLNSQLSVIRLWFEREFRRQLPVSAEGDTALHRSMGFDHQGRVDVRLHPDSDEGRRLRSFLEQIQISYFAFRGSKAESSTGAHIHIGPPSLPAKPAN